MAESPVRGGRLSWGAAAQLGKSGLGLGAYWLAAGAEGGAQRERDKVRDMFGMAWGAARPLAARAEGGVLELTPCSGPTMDFAWPCGRLSGLRFRRAASGGPASATSAAPQPRHRPRSAREKFQRLQSKWAKLVEICPGGDVGWLKDAVWLNNGAAAWGAGCWVCCQSRVGGPWGDFKVSSVACLQLSNVLRHGTGKRLRSCWGKRRPRRPHPASKSSWSCFPIGRRP